MGCCLMQDRHRERVIINPPVGWRELQAAQSRAKKKKKKKRKGNAKKKEKEKKKERKSSSMIVKVVGDKLEGVSGGLRHELPQLKRQSQGLSERTTPSVSLSPPKSRKQSRSAVASVGCGGPACLRVGARAWREEEGGGWFCCRARVTDGMRWIRKLGNLPRLPSGVSLS